MHLLLPWNPHYNIIGSTSFFTSFSFNALNICTDERETVTLSELKCLFCVAFTGYYLLQENVFRPLELLQCIVSLAISLN